MGVIDQFDPERFRLSVRNGNAIGATASGRRAHATRRPRMGEFLGPIPLDWLAAASQLPGKSLHVGLVLWHLRHLRRQWTVQWEPSKAAVLGINRFTAYRALSRLEEAGLVKLERHVGRCPVVTIVQRLDKQDFNGHEGP